MKRIFFYIAFSRYFNLRSLITAENDALKLAAFFRKLGFEVRGLTAKDFGDNPRKTVVDLRAYLNDFRLLLNAGDQVVVYVAGHGATDGQGKPVLLMPSALQEDLEAPRSRYLLQLYDELLDVIGSWRGVRCAAVFDTCRTALNHLPTRDFRVFTRAPVEVPGRHPELGRGETASPGAVPILYACKPGFVAVEVTGTGDDKMDGSVLRCAFEDAAEARIQSGRPLRLDHELEDEIAARYAVRMQAIDVGHAPELREANPAQRPYLLVADDAEPFTLWSPPDAGSGKPGWRVGLAKLAAVAVSLVVAAVVAPKAWEAVQAWRSGLGEHPVAATERDPGPAGQGVEGASAPAVLAASEPMPVAAPIAAATAPAPTPAEAAPAAPPAPEPDPAVKAAAERAARIESLLVGARADLGADRLTYPTGNNALEKYRAVLELEADNAHALSGLSQLLDRYEALFEVALTRTELDRAQSLLDRARQVDAGSERVQALAGRLEAARIAEQQAAERAREEAARIARERELARAATEAPRTAALPAVPDIHGWSASQVQALQRETAAALGIADPLKVKDCAACPEMVLIPAGRFTMGEELGVSVAPQTDVMIDRPFLVSKYEVSVEEFSSFASATNFRAETEPYGCKTWRPTSPYEGDGWYGNKDVSWRNPGYKQTTDHPVTCVSYGDAQMYAKWLSERSGKEFRLLSEAEWEYAARAGTNSQYYWGNDTHRACDYANFSDQSFKEKYRVTNVRECRDDYVHTAPVGSKVANPFGLHDMLGNVDEWTQDCWNFDNNARADGRARMSGDCSSHTLRGGSWFTNTIFGKSASRFAGSWAKNTYGFRVAMTIPAH